MLDALRWGLLLGEDVVASARRRRRRRPGRRPTSDGSFSAVSTATIASKDAFFSIFRDLQDLHSFAPLQSQILQSFRKFFRENFSDFCKILLNFCEISAKISKILIQIWKISELRMVQKDANLVDFEKCCKMRLCSLS